MKKAEEIIELLEAEVKRIQDKANEGLSKLNMQISKEDANVKTMYLLSEWYYINVARYAWAYRAELIVSYKLQSLIDKCKNEN